MNFQQKKTWRALFWYFYTWVDPTKWCCHLKVKLSFFLSFQRSSFYKIRRVLKNGHIISVYHEYCYGKTFWCGPLQVTPFSWKLSPYRSIVLSTILLFQKKLFKRRKFSSKDFACLSCDRNFYISTGRKLWKQIQLIMKAIDNFPK